MNPVELRHGRYSGWYLFGLIRFGSMRREKARMQVICMPDLLD